MRKKFTPGFEPRIIGFLFIASTNVPHLPVMTKVLIEQCKPDLTYDPLACTAVFFLSLYHTPSVYLAYPFMLKALDSALLHCNF